MTSRAISVTINEVPMTLEIAPDRVALELLRDDLHLTGTKEGCAVGVCGLCTVLVDGQPLSACLLPAVLLDRTSVTTIEGLSSAGSLSDLQEAFIRHGAFQCGICTPGQIMAATALLDEHPDPTRDQIVAGMAGNLCRCTGYEGIVAAIAAVAALRAGG